VRLQGVTAAARDRGWQTIVLTAAGPELGAATVGPSGESIIPLRGDTSTGVSGRRAWHLVLFGFRAWKHARRLGSANVVLADPPPTSGLAALLIARRLRARSVYYLADSWGDMVSQHRSGMGGMLARAVVAAENLCIRRSTAVVAVTNRLGAAARQAGGRAVVLAENGTDVETFSPVGDAWTDPWAGTMPYFLYAGNYGVVHGAPVFAIAAENLWQQGHVFGLVFMGYGSDGAALADVRDRWPELLHLVEPASPETAAAAFRGARGGLCSVSTLQVTQDARPAKALASLAAGCPLVFAGAGDFADEVRANNLGLVAPWDPDAVADLLVAALDQDRSMTRSRSLADYARVHFDRRSAGTRVVDLLEKLRESGDRRDSGGADV
jgi:glycosyltransferase involved in cell wall biosynthesis